MSSRKKRIAIFADVPPAWADEKLAGVGKHVAPTWLACVRELFARQEDWEVHWVTFGRGVYRHHHRREGNQTFHVYPRCPLSVAQPLHFIYARLVAAFFLLLYRPNVVHAWGTEVEYAVSIMGASCYKILSMQGVLTAIGARCAINDYERRQTYFEQRALRRMDLITTESDWCAERVREIVPQKTVLLWEYSPLKTYFSLSRQMSPVPVCLMAGTDSPTKNHALAIRAFSRPELSHVQLWLAGVQPGRYPEAPANIKALGVLNREQMMETMAQAWCVVHPSFADSSPNVVKEARVMGIPVIVSSETGGTQYVEHGKSGYIISPNDEQALVDSVLHLTASPVVSTSMGEHGRESCRRALSEETMASGLLRVYRHAWEQVYK